MVGPPFRVVPFLFTSSYSQKMRKLSCKIFNDFYVPELNRADLDHGQHHAPVYAWTSKWIQDLRTVDRSRQAPLDLESHRNPKYYPAHPQIREMTHRLREYGLYRDEHRDFNEAMKAVAISKGKVFRQRRGPNKK